MIYLIFSIILIIPLVAIGYCFVNKQCFAEVLVLSAMFCVTGMVLLIAWVNKTYDGGAIALITDAAQGWTGYIKDAPDIFLLQFPSTVITVAVAYCYIDMRLIHRVRRWFGLSTSSMKSFAEFKASRGMCNIALLTMLLTMVQQLLGDT